MRVERENNTAPKRLSWSKRRTLRREASRLQREIDKARALLHETFGNTLDFQNPAVRLISSQIDVLVVRYERIHMELADSNRDREE